MVAAFNPADRVRYSSEQIQQYLDRIRLPQKYRNSTVLTNPDTATAEERLHFLSKLVKYHIVAIPFENLDLHYSTHHTISIDPVHVFKKIVTSNTGRGGYCMEVSILMGTVLRSLGYDTVSTAGRVNEAILPMSQAPDWPGPQYLGWDHMVNLVTIGSQKYLVDVGFGSNSPTKPVPLVHTYSDKNISGGPLGDHRYLIQKTYIADTTNQSSPEQRLWVYSVRFNDEMNWTPCYCFGETEFLPRDFEMINFFTSKHPSSFFTFVVLCQRAVMDEETEEIIGDITLAGTDLKERKYGSSTDMCQITNEQERIEGLEKHLGISLSSEDRAGVKGLPSEIV